MKHERISTQDFGPEQADFVADSPGGFSALVEGESDDVIRALARAEELLVPGRPIDNPLVGIEQNT